MLKAVGIHKRFGGVIALSDASLELEPGEVRALVGGNGSGKSTLSKILAGSYKPDKGKIYVDDQFVKINSPKDSQQLGIFLTYQELSLFPNLTVAENLLIGELPNIAGVITDQQALSREAKEVLELLKLDHHEKKLVSDVPLDDKYMIELAKAMIQKPRYLLIDEVASALRREQVQQITDIVRHLSENGCGVLYVTHRLHEVYSICKTITVMRSGSMVLTTSLDKVTPEEVVAYIAPLKTSENNGTEKITFTGTEPLTRIATTAEAEEELLDVKNLKLPEYEKPFSLKLKRGEIIGIAGLQGQGQSRILRTIFGAIPGHKTEIKIRNKNVTIDSPAAAIQLGIGFLSGDREKEGVFPIRSVKENIEAVPEKFSLQLPGDKKLTSNDVVSLLRIVLGSLKQPIRSLSGGNQQKVIIGRWMTIKPDILICDDPTKGVDFSARAEVHSIFRSMAEQGAGVIISSSDDTELINVADRILVIYEGSVVKELKGDEMTEDNIIAASIPLKARSES